MSSLIDARLRPRLGLDNVAAIDVNAELFDTWSMYSSVALTPLRSPALTVNSGVRSETGGV
jgi:hypothetical protein